MNGADAVINPSRAQLRPAPPGRLRRSGRAAFTLPELLIVIGIIACVAGILLPAINSARREAQRVRCLANLRTLGQALHAYAAENNGWPFPSGGAPAPPHARWPAIVFKVPALAQPLPYDPDMYTLEPYDPEAFPPGPFTPEVLVCPSDEDPAEAHSYMLNGHLPDRGYRMGSRDLGGRSSDAVILAGEKRSRERDYYMNTRDFKRATELFRHGVTKGSNYLFVDGHAETQLPQTAAGGLDPWDVSGGH